MENTNRSVFGLNGVTGMLIATVLLLSILVGLTIWGISAQQAVADKPYEIKNPSAIKMIDSANANLKDKQEMIMNENMDKIITFALVILAVVSAWAVLTPNHLFIG